jgi:hypothetical protein
MLSSFVIVIVGLAAVFTLYSIVSKEMFATMVSIILWAASMASVLVLEVPYQFYNATDNTVITGTQEMTGPTAALSWLFFGFTILMIIYGFYLLSKSGAKAVQGQLVEGM